MSSPSDFLEYTNALLDAILAGRITAREAREMTPEQHAEYKAKLIGEEQAELERAQALQNEGRTPPEA